MLPLCFLSAVPVPHSSTRTRSRPAAWSACARNHEPRRPGHRAFADRTSPALRRARSLKADVLQARVADAVRAQVGALRTAATITASATNAETLSGSATEAANEARVISWQRNAGAQLSEATRAVADQPPPREFGLPEKDERQTAVADRDDQDAADKSFDTVLQELTAIQKDGPRNVAILGTRYASYLHQQIIELLTYANVLVGNHVFTSGAGGTNAAVIRGALRAEMPHLLTVVLPQSMRRQPPDTQEQLKKVGNLVQMQHNDDMPLDVASQLCNSDILSRCTHFIAFAFHDSDVVLEAVRQAKELRMITTVMFLD
jgi:hypothetical protein